MLRIKSILPDKFNTLKSIPCKNHAYCTLDNYEKSAISLKPHYQAMQ